MSDVRRSLLGNQRKGWIDRGRNSGHGRGGRDRSRNGAAGSDGE
jgi:hypothetical protein